MDSMWALQPAGQEKGTPGNSEAFSSAVMGGIQTACHHTCAQMLMGIRPAMERS